MERIAVRREYARSSLAAVVPRLAAAKFAVGCVPAALLATVAALAFCSTAAAQDAKGSAAHIKAVTAAIDGDCDQGQRRARRRTGRRSASTTRETRFSKLNQINADNVKDLGLAWSYNLESTRGVEATPLVVDGIMYVTASWSVVHAIDVAHRQADLDLRSRGAARERLQGLLRRRQPRRGALQGQGLRRRLRRPADRPRRGDRQGGLGEGHHHRPRAAPTRSPARRASSTAR